uniref:C-type lectin domain-containing protein n=1 Tax=Monopterus albus TaxID=43700 RepID=A0A3Q3K6M4_MONAL
MAGEFLFHQYWLMNLFCSCYSIQHHRRRLAFYKLGNDSYKLVAQKMRWDEARRQCKADDADLASILNPITQAYITLRISKHNEPVWIGLNSNTGGRFKWVDNWLLSYTKWGRDEPKNNYGCASLVSIQDPEEGKFIQQNLEILQDEAKSFWIGLYKTHEGEHTEVKFSVKKCHE